MIKEYLFRVTKQVYLQVEAENEEEAFEKAEERSIDDAFDEDILDMELLDVCDENYKAYTKELMKKYNFD